MFSAFLDFFKKNVQYDIYGSEYRTFVIGFGGMQFGRGLFTVFTKGDLSYWNNLIAEVFPKYRRGIYLFGHDWRGRCYAVVEPGTESEKILVFDPGKLDVAEVPLTFMEFVNEAIPSKTDECLGLDDFIEWYNSSEIKINDIQCVGYDEPPFKGGPDNLSNAEIADIDFYWQRMADEAKEIRGVEDEEERQEHEFFAQQAELAGDFFAQQKKREVYIRKNVDTYLEKFKKMNSKGSKVSWNWCGFLFCEFWLAYRKMYGLAVAVWAIPYVIGTVLGVALALMDMDMQTTTILLNAVSAVVGIAFVIVVGMFSDHWYKKRLDKLVAAEESAETEEEREKIYKKGGVSGIALAIALVISLASSLLLELI